MILFWTEESLRDLSEIREYIALDSSEAANRTIRRIIDATEQLKQFPRSGRAVQAEVREIITAPYRIFYGIEADRVVVIGVAHGMRDAARFLEHRRGQQ